MKPAALALLLLLLPAALADAPQESAPAPERARIERPTETPWLALACFAGALAVGVVGWRRHAS